MVHVMDTDTPAHSRTPRIGGGRMLGRKEALVPSRHPGKDVAGPLPGLPNLGNTCYMGSVLQCLLNTPGCLREGIEVFATMPGLCSDDSPPALQLACDLAQLAAEYSQTEAAPLRRDHRGCLATFKDALGSLDERYEECEQQDALEFLGCLLEGLDSGFRILLKRLACAVPEGLVRRVCGVTTYTTRKCRRCQARLEVDFKTDTSLGLPVVSPAAQANQELRLQEEMRPTSLEDLILASQMPEEIQGYDCENCRRLAERVNVPHSRSRMVQRSGLISATSDVMVISLYRFLNVFDAEGGFSAVKLRRPVAIPTELELSTGTYRLYGIVSHCGLDLNSGHYIAAVRSLRDGIWYECDDSRVEPLLLRSLYEDAEVTGTRPGADPFILFYYRISSDVELAE